METLSITLVYLATFLIIALASKQIGEFFKKVRLPLISGFLAAGLIAGPYVLGLIPERAVAELRFVDEIALAMIAFAAGNELNFKALRDRLRSISLVTVGLVLFTFPICALAIVLLADYLPFMQSMPPASRAAVAILGGAILVARSPSSAIAIVNELRAKGPFTRTALGVTVIMDVVVIVLFGINSSIADALLTNLSFNLGFVGLLLLELAAAIGFAYVLFRIIQAILSMDLHRHLKTGAVLALGYGVFIFSVWLREVTHVRLPFEILVEPLLVCMVAGFLLASFSPYKGEFSRILHDVGPAIYILFFTLTGASLALDVLLRTWPLALALFGVRLLGIFLGAFSGGSIAGDPVQHNRLSWMAYVTQAGVGLGLAKEVAVEFPTWGEAFSTVIISVIVLNQVFGPPLFKWVLRRVEEDHPRGQAAAFDGVRDALIFGIKPQSVTLARQLRMHDWQVRLVDTDPRLVAELDAPDTEIRLIDEIDLETLRLLETERADAIVSFLPPDLSYRLCELAYEHFGTESLVVHLRDQTGFERFHKLGVRVVEPLTAVVSLLEHYVRSPAGTSLLLGSEDGQEMIDQVIRNPAIHGAVLRDLPLPIEVLILSIQREGHTMLSRGFTRLQLGDKITMVGPKEKLEAVALQFEG